MASSTRDKGRFAEQLAVDHLQAAGLQVVDRNVTLAGAEIDIVARHSDSPGIDTLIFVEVRSRENDERGGPAETVSRAKQQRILRAAEAWLLRHELWGKVEVRLDVIAVLLPESGQQKAPEIEWIAGAFEA